MSADDYRDEFDRIEDEACDTAGRLILAMAVAITLIWLGALAAYLPEIIKGM